MHSFIEWRRLFLPAVKAITAAQLSMASLGVYSVTLDEAIEAMRLTASDMSVKYKETSLSVGICIPHLDDVWLTFQQLQGLAVSPDFGLLECKDADFALTDDCEDTSYCPSVLILVVMKISTHPEAYPQFQRNSL